MLLSIFTRHNMCDLQIDNVRDDVWYIHNVFIIRFFSVEFISIALICCAREFLFFLPPSTRATALINFSAEYVCRRWLWSSWKQQINFSVSRRLLYFSSLVSRLFFPLPHPPFRCCFSASRAQPASLGLFRRECIVYMKSESFARACCFHVYELSDETCHRECETFARACRRCCPWQWTETIQRERDSPTECTI